MLYSVSTLFFTIKNGIIAIVPVVFLSKSANVFNLTASQ